MKNVQLIPLTDIPLIQPGDDIAGLIFSSTQKAKLVLRDDDIVVIAQKIVSKAEGQFVQLVEVTPSAKARQLAQITGKPESAVNKMVEGKLKKFYEEVCLLEQPFIRDTNVRVKEILTSMIAKIGENIVIRRFARYQVGEEA